jgi:hypothetical protein
MVPATISWLDDGRADRLQHRPRRLEVLRLAADHDRQAALDGPGLTAGDRRVDGAHAAGLRRLGQPDRDVGPDGAGVDQQGAGLGRVEHAAVAEDDGLDVRRVGKHGQDDVRVADRFGDVGGAPAAGGDQLVDLVPAAVVADHLVTGLEEVGGHRAAHDAESDHRDGGHDCS